MRALLVVALLLAACGPASSAPSSAAVSPAATSPHAPAAGVLGACRLPVQMVGSPPSVGWLQLPSGSFSPDPTSAGHMSKYNSMIAWDSATAAWVATDPPYLSPDGTSFVAPLVSSTIDVVDARTGATEMAIPNRNGPDTVIGYLQQAIYLIRTGNYGGVAPAGLWKIDTSSWKMSQVASQPINWEIVADTEAWGTSANHGSLERLDLSTGVITQVISDGPEDLQLAGFVRSGVLVVNGSGPLNAAQIISQDGSSQQVDLPAPLDGAVAGAWTFQDGGEILFPSTVGLYAFDADHGFRELAGNPDVFRVLGRCKVA
jgi:hypothetical protein